MKLFVLYPDETTHSSDARHAVTRVVAALTSVKE